jgi:hypothetical protein
MALACVLYVIWISDVTNSFLSIRPLSAPLKTSNGVSTQPLADTVMAHVTLFVLPELFAALLTQVFSLNQM